MKLFENANMQLGYMSKLVEKTLSKDSRGTDTDQDAAEEIALAEDNHGMYIHLKDLNFLVLDSYAFECLIFFWFCNYVDYGMDPEYYPGVEMSPARNRDNSHKEYRCEHCPAGFDKPSNLTLVAI